MASYRGRTKVKISRDTLISNLSYMYNMQELHDANQYKWFVNGSDKVNYSKIIKYTFSTILFFREMSKQTVPVPMEVEEVGMDEYMLGTRGCLMGRTAPVRYRVRVLGTVLGRI